MEACIQDVIASALSCIEIVLLEPTHPGNIGAVARAMKNMGLTRLVLVKPAVFPSSHADARASHAKDVLQQARVVEDFSAAVAKSQLIIGTSARSRSLPWPMLTPAACAETIHQYLQTAATIDKSKLDKSTYISETAIQVSIVFGREHSGLHNQELQSCNYHLFIPANPAYSSLNLAAAVQVVCYEIYQRFLLQLPEQSASKKTLSEQPHTDIQIKKDKKFVWSEDLFGVAWDLPKASRQQVEGFMQHFEQMLLAINFFDPENPKMIMQRLRRLFLRIHLDTMEVNLLRGILNTIQKRVKNKNKM